jgi:hypothetical protein
VSSKILNLVYGVRFSATLPRSRGREVRRQVVNLDDDSSSLFGSAICLRSIKVMQMPLKHRNTAQYRARAPVSDRVLESLANPPALGAGDRQFESDHPDHLGR